MKYLYAYKTIAVPAVAATLFACYLLWQTDASGYAIIYLLWLKLIVLGGSFCHIYFFKAEMLYFFHNLGLSRRGFYATLAIVDLAVFSVVMTVMMLFLDQRWV